MSAKSTDGTKKPKVRNESTKTRKARESVKAMDGRHWELYVECRGCKEYTEHVPYNGESTSEMEEYILKKHADEGPMFYRATLIDEEEAKKPKDQVSYVEWCLMNQHEFLD